MRPVGVCTPRTATSVNWRNTVCRHRSMYSRRCTACRCSPYTGHRLVSCSCHTVWTFCCVCTPLSLDIWLLPSWVVVEDDEVDAGAGVLADDVDVSLSSADNWPKNCRRDICAFVVFLNRIHALMLAVFQKTASGHRRQPDLVDICRHMKSSMSTPHLFSL